MNFDTSKYLGGVGAILLFIGALVSYPYLYSSAISLIGLILLLIGLKGLADYYKDASIFNNFLYGTIIGIVGIIVTAIVAFYWVLQGLIGLILPGWTFGDWTALQTMKPIVPTTELLIPLVGGIIVVIGILFVFAVVTAYMMRKSLQALSKKSTVGLFATTGTLLLIGAILTIVVFGYILIWIAMIILAVAFFTMKPLPAEAASVTAQPPASV